MVYNLWPHIHYIFPLARPIKIYRISYASRWCQLCANIAGSCSVCSQTSCLSSSSYTISSLSHHTQKRTIPSLFWCFCTSDMICHKGPYFCEISAEMLQQNFSVTVDAVDFHSGQIWSRSPHNHNSWVYLTLKRARSQKNYANNLTAGKDYCTGKLLPIILFLSFVIGLSEQWMDKAS